MMFRPSCHCFTAALLLLATILAGCGSSNPLGRKAISGAVTLNGAPLESGSIEFTPLVAGGVSSGAMIEAGRYSIASQQGLPVGKYQVAITDNPPAAALPPGHMPGDALPPPPAPRIPAEWNTKSQHTIEVTDRGPNKFDFTISSQKK